MIEISGLLGSVTIPSPSTMPVVPCFAQHVRGADQTVSLCLRTVSPTESGESLLWDDGVERENLQHGRDAMLESMRGVLLHFETSPHFRCTIHQVVQATLVILGYNHQWIGVKRQDLPF